MVVKDLQKSANMKCRLKTIHEKIEGFVCYSRACFDSATELITELKEGIRVKISNSNFLERLMTSRIWKLTNVQM